MATTKAFLRKPTPFQYCLLAAMLLLVPFNILIGRFAHDYWIGQAEDQLLAGLSKKASEERAKVVSDYLLYVDQRLERYSISADAVNALSGGLAEKLATEKLQKLFDNYRAIHFLPYGRLQEANDPQDKAVFSFAQTDMINRVERGQLVWPEATKVDDEWRISFVKTITQDEKILGTVFLSLSLADIHSALGATNIEHGATVVLQQFPKGKPQPIVELGRGQAGKAQTIDIENSYWSIQFSPSTVLSLQADISPLTLFIALSATALLTLIGGFFIARLGGRYWQLAIDQQSAPKQNPQTSIDETRDLLYQKNTLLDVDVNQEDAELLGVGQHHPDHTDDMDPLDIEDIPEHPKSASPPTLPKEIFRAYDIRGIVESQLTSDTVAVIGRAIATQAIGAGENTLVVGRDGRSHSKVLSEHLIDGILSTGCNVINIGQVPTPLVYFATHKLSTTSSGVMVTASHNPAQYNGFKIVIDGNSLAEEGIQTLFKTACEGKFSVGAGTEEALDITGDYINTILNDIALTGTPKIVLDAGNGVGGEVGVRLFEEFGCTVIPLFCDVDGRFPNHQPDPSDEKNLSALVAAVKENAADMGIALDGDADRIGLVTSSGAIIRPDRLLMLLAKDIVARKPGADVIFDVKSSRELNKVISGSGGRPIMWKTGHSPMKAKMKNSNAILAGELSGHIFIADRWPGFDDGIYVGARLLEIMCLRDQDLDSIFAKLPNLPATPEIKIPVAEDKKFQLIKQLTDSASFGDARLTTLDGLRVDFAKGWGLVRASNTSPALTLRFEAETDDELQNIQAQFKNLLLNIDKELAIPF